MARRSHAQRRRALAVAVLSVALLEVRCGARSALELPDPCAEAVTDGGGPQTPGGKRSCHDTCGAGEQVCEHGYWQPCVVPAATRSCANTCGAGEQSCVADAWLPCAVPVAMRPCSSLCGPGTETCADDAWGACSAPLPGPPTLKATVRNIHLGQPDFLQSCCTGGLDPGIVAAALGADSEPVYAGHPVTGTLTTHGQTDFDAWYHDRPGVNLSAPFDLPFVPQSALPGTNVFDNEAFFPIDNQLFGNQGGEHNYDFTLEAHGQILYGGGETYGFSSDDDLWVFINRRLVVDLGGFHAGMSQGIALDAIAGATGLVKGQEFALDVFYANREPPGAVLMISVPQADLWSCP